MAENPTPAAPRRFPLKTILIIAGASLAGVGATVGATALVVMKVERVHKAWCDRIHLFCAKPAAVVAAEKPKPPEGCPDFLMRASLTPRGSDEAATQVTAALRGKVNLTAQGKTLTGRANIICFDNRFLASFTNIEQGLTYQCMGSIEGNSFEGVCDRSMPGRWDIGGEFFDDTKLRAEIEDRRPVRVVTDEAEEAAEKAMDLASEEVKKMQKASKGKKEGGEAKSGEKAGEGKSGEGGDDKKAGDEKHGESNGAG